MRMPEPRASKQASSVNRLGNLLDFDQLFKIFGNNEFAQTSHILRQIFVKVSKSIIFQVKSFLGNFYRYLATFYWSHCKKGSWLVGRTNISIFRVRILFC